jgi:hypothetical protein
MLHAVKTEKTLVPKIPFSCLVYRFEDDHLPRGTSNYMPWISSRIESASYLQLVSSCGVGKLTIGSSLTSWWDVQIAILSWIVPVCLDSSPAEIARWKVPSLIRIGPRIQLWHSSQRMAYYSRYATERKDVMLGVPLLRLVTFEP